MVSRLAWSDVALGDIKHDLSLSNFFHLSPQIRTRYQWCTDIRALLSLSGTTTARLRSTRVPTPSNNPSRPFWMKTGAFRIIWRQNPYPVLWSVTWGIQIYWWKRRNISSNNLKVFIIFGHLDAVNNLKISTNLFIWTNNPRFNLSGWKSTCYWK